MKNAAAGISAAPSIKASCTAILKHPLVSLDLRRVIGSGRRFRAGEIGRGAGGSTSMIYNRVGRTDVHLSAVGFGTCQLRLVPEAQALAALTRGFELGVNWVHTSPDYGGADELVGTSHPRIGARRDPRLRRLWRDGALRVPLRESMPSVRPAHPPTVGHRLHR